MAVQLNVLLDDAIDLRDGIGKQRRAADGGGPVRAAIAIGAAQAAEDRAFWLGTKAGNDPSTFYGLRHQTGVTDANPAPTAGTAMSRLRAVQAMANVTPRKASSSVR